MRTIITIFILIVINACSVDKKNFKLNDGVHLNEYGVISPFFIEQLLEAPFRSHHGWNDSLIKTIGIRNIKIKTHGLKNPDATAEERSLFFSRDGHISNYSYVKYDDSDLAVPFINIDYKENQGSVSYYFGDKSKHSIVLRQSYDQSEQTWNKENGTIEQFKLVGTVLKPRVLLTYQGNNISKLSVILRMNEPVKRVGEILTELNIDISTLGFTDKAVIYVDEKYLPIEMYQLNESLVQTMLLAEWKYENHKKLIAYKRYINGSLLKDFSIEYRQDRLLDGFVFNRVRYTIAYQ